MRWWRAACRRRARRAWAAPSPTVGGVVFIAGTNDARLRAFDADNGRELWADRLEASGHATPMTYRGKSGRQFVVIAAGGRGYLQPHDRGRRGRVRTAAALSRLARERVDRATIAPCPREPRGSFALAFLALGLAPSSDAPRRTASPSPRRPG